MKKYLVVIIILTSFVLAENNAVDFLESGLSARSLALGNSTVAAGGYLDSIFFNPAVLARQTSELEINSAGINNFEEVEQKSMGAAFPAKKVKLPLRGNCGINFATLYVGNILKTRWNDDRPEVIDTFDSQKSNFTFNYAEDIDPYLSWGANLKKYSYTIDNYFANAWGFDLGIVYRLPENLFDMPSVFGVTLHNVGRTSVAWSTDHVDTMPMRLNLGIAVYRNFFDRKLMGSIELEKDEVNKGLLRCGTEYWLVNNFLALRAGLEEKRVNYGVGLQLSGLRADFAQSDYDDLGLVKRVTISYLF